METMIKADFAICCNLLSNRFKSCEYTQCCMQLEAFHCYQIEFHFSSRETLCQSRN